MIKRYINIDIENILKHESIMILFQPIISISRSKVIGLEALARGSDPKTGELIAPLDLFHEAKQKNLSLELDRLCRKKAIEKFKQIYQTNKNLLLFINIDSSIIQNVVGSNHILEMVQNNGVPFQNIVLEINQTELKNMDQLIKFISTYREYGFLISLDDVGTGFSNLDRIIVTEPDIIKLDRQLITNIDKDYHKQQIIKAMISLAENTRTLVVAEGVEKEAEAMMLLHLGVDMLQGFYISHPTEIKMHKIPFLDSLVTEVTHVYKHHIGKKLKNYKVNHAYIHQLIEKFCMELEKKQSSNFDTTLKEFAEIYSFIECFYILDLSGVQITDTVYEDQNFHKKESPLFSPALEGTDHSLKKYYYNLMNLEKQYFITEPYISLATGNQCITASMIFKNPDKDFILCVDFDYLDVQQFNFND